MIVRNSLPSRVQTLVAGTLLLLFGTMAFSKPMLDSGIVASEAPAIEVAPVRSAGVAELPAVAVSMTTVNHAKIEVADAPMPARAVLAGKKTMAAKKPAAPMPVAMKATAESDRVEIIAAAAEPVITVALTETAAVSVPVVAQSAVHTAVTVDAKPETYRDWSAIQALAKASAEARDPAVESITKWNALVEACGLPLRQIAEHRNEACGEIFKAINNGELYNFWAQCRTFITTYNRLAKSFSRAAPAQFTDLYLVRSLMVKNYQTLSEFCNTSVYQQKYPKLVDLVRYPIRVRSSAMEQPISQGPAGIFQNGIWIDFATNYSSINPAAITTTGR